MAETKTSLLYLKKKKHSERGFSLLEILIVMVIMATLATMSSTAIKTAMRNKKKIDSRLRVEAMVFDCLKIMASDIEKAFHYQQPLYELDRMALSAGQQQPGNPNDPTQAIPPPQFNPQNQQNPLAKLGPKPLKLTQFIGKSQSLHFTTINNQRITANAQESNLIEVGYFLANCKSRLTEKSSQCLWRRSAIVVDNDVTRGGLSTAMIENITKFELEYLSEELAEKDWKKDWISDQNGSANTQNRFPYMVKITIEVHDKESKEIGKFAQTIIANIRFPNNSDPAIIFSGGVKSPTSGGK